MCGGSDSRGSRLIHFQMSIHATAFFGRLGLSPPRVHPFDFVPQLLIADRSIQEYTLIWTIQREGRYLNIEPLTAFTLHLVSPAHHPRCGVERRAAGIFIALARLEDWLLPDNTWPLDLSQFATRV